MRQRYHRVPHLNRKRHRVGSARRATRKNQHAGRLVKVVAPSTIRPRIDCVYGTKEQGRRSEWPEEGQGNEGCTKTGTVGWRREKIGRSCRVRLLAEHAPDARKADELASAAAFWGVCYRRASNGGRTLAAISSKESACHGPRSLWEPAGDQECVSRLGLTGRIGAAAPPWAQHRNRRPNLAWVRVPGNLEGCTPSQVIRVRQCLFYSDAGFAPGRRFFRNLIWPSWFDSCSAT